MTIRLPFAPTCEDALDPGRRLFLGGVSATFASWAMLPRLGHAAGTGDPRLLVVILRGALDGLATLAPVGDPYFSALRPDESVMTGAVRLDDLFALNPAMPHLAAMFGRGEALGVHAVATPYRGRSHFDGQDVLESGYTRHQRADTGWLNRALQRLAAAGERATPREGLAVGPTVPLILRGGAPVTAWGPDGGAAPSLDTIARLRALYADTDPALFGALEAGLRIEAVAAADGGMSATGTDGGMAMMGGTSLRGIERAFVEAAAGAGRLLADPEGPRVGALSFDGWDTHSNDGVLDGRLSRQLSALDGALEALRTSMSAVWSQTVVAVVTEFGRTAAENGSSGTDHGTGGAMLLLGGAVRGGRVLADWPGLAPERLHEGRDLTPTTDMRGVLGGVLRDHLGLARGDLAHVFPDAGSLRPTEGLVRGL